MKFVIKFLLFTLSAPILLIAVLSINLRFQLLSSKFWLTTFDRANVYYQISNSVVSKLNSNVVAEGGNVNDIGTLSELISANSLKGLIEENINSILLYANGQSKELILTVPLAIENLPQGVNPTNLEDLSKKMTFGEFVKEFNITGISEQDIKILASMGLWSYILFGISIVLIIVIIEAGYLITTPGKRISITFINFVLSGLTLFSVYYVLTEAGRLIKVNYIGSMNIGTSIFAIVIPPLLNNLAQIWLWIGAATVIIGIVFIFIKKPIKVINPPNYK